MSNAPLHVLSVSDEMHDCPWRHEELTLSHLRGPIYDD